MNTMIQKLILRIIVIFALMFNVCFIYGTNYIESLAAWDYSAKVKEDWSVKDANDPKKINDGVSDKVKKIMGTLINVMRIVGTGVAIIMITYVAIKYMSAAPEEKAEFKKSAMAFIVGAVVLFASTNILGIISDFATKNTQ